MFYYLTSSGAREGDKCSLCEGAWQPVRSQLRESWPSAGQESIIHFGGFI